MPGELLSAPLTETQHLSLSDIFHIFGPIPSATAIVSAVVVVRGILARTGLTGANYGPVFVIGISLGALITAATFPAKTTGALWFSEVLSAVIFVLVVAALGPRSAVPRSSRTHPSPAKAVIMSAIGVAFAAALNYFFATFVHVGKYDHNICENYNTIFGNSAYLFVHFYLANFLISSYFIWSIIYARNLFKKWTEKI